MEDVLQPSEHPRAPALDLPQQLHILFVLEPWELEAALAELGPHCWVMVSSSPMENPNPSAQGCPHALRLFNLSSFKVNYQTF